MVYLGKENRSCLHAIRHGSVAIHSLHSYTTTVEWIAIYIAELPSILDRFFTSYASTTSTSIGMEGGGWGATKWWVNPLCKLKSSKWHQLVLFSPLHNTHNS